MSFTICITGQRDTHIFSNLIEKMLIIHKPSLVIFGDCTGVDTDAKNICEKLKISYKVYPANWKKYGLKAGPIRNKDMIDTNPNLVLAFHSNINTSKGTKNTVNLAKKK